MGPAFDPEGMKSKAYSLQPLPDTCLLTVAITSTRSLQFPFMCHFTGLHLWYDYKSARLTDSQTYQNACTQINVFRQMSSVLKHSEYPFWSQLK